MWILDELSGIEWGVTEKANGSSCTIYWKDGSLHVCSRNWELKKDERNAFWRAALDCELEGKLADYPDFALQGELIGPGIQGNRYALPKIALRFFDVYHIPGRRYLDFWQQRNLCRELELECVPLLDTEVHPPSLDTLLSFAEGQSLLNLKTEREGMVWRPLQERTDPRIGRVAFKVISNKFLLSLRD